MNKMRLILNAFTVAILTLATLTLAPSISAASILIEASTSSCGPYKVMMNSRVIDLPILNPNSQSELQKAYGELYTSVNGWMSFFTNNKDSKTQIHSLCYGYYDDLHSTGPNALAIGNNNLVIGVGMMALIQNNLTNLVNQKLRENNPQEKAYVQNLTPEAAQTFLVLHELGHILQNINGLTFEGPTSRRKELHADCSAAFMMTLASMLNNATTQSFFNAAFTAQFYAFALGDFHTTSSDHHGTYEERQQAFDNGMMYAINAKNSEHRDISKFTSADVVNYCRQSY